MRGKPSPVIQKFSVHCFGHNGCSSNLFVHDFSHYIFFQLFGVSLGLSLVELSIPNLFVLLTHSRTAVRMET